MEKFVDWRRDTRNFMMLKDILKHCNGRRRKNFLDFVIFTGNFVALNYYGYLRQQVIFISSRRLCVCFMISLFVCLTVCLSVCLFVLFLCLSVTTTLTLKKNVKNNLVENWLKKSQNSV